MSTQRLPLPGPDRGVYPACCDDERGTLLGGPPRDDGAGLRDDGTACACCGAVAARICSNLPARLLEPGRRQRLQKGGEAGAGLFELGLAALLVVEQAGALDGRGEEVAQDLVDVAVGGAELEDEEAQLLAAEDEGRDREGALAAGGDENPRG